MVASEQTVIGVDAKMPDASLSYRCGDDIVHVQTKDLFTEGVYILVGVPGAFTPICTEDHLPTLLKTVDRLKTLGVQDIYCISEDNPWALHEWKQVFKNGNKITFLSDGNRELLDQLKIYASEEAISIKGKYGRFYAIVEDGYIRLLRIEKTVLDVSCTSGGFIEADLKAYL